MGGGAIEGTMDSPVKPRRTVLELTDRTPLRPYAVAVIVGIALGLLLSLGILLIR